MFWCSRLLLISRLRRCQLQFPFSNKRAWIACNKRLRGRRRLGKLQLGALRESEKEEGRIEVRA